MLFVLLLARTPISWDASVSPTDNPKAFEVVVVRVFRI